MEIRYNKKVQRKELIFGLLLLLFGMAFVWKEPQNIFRYGLLILAIAHLVSGIYKLKKPYLRLDSTFLTRNGLFPKNILLSELVRIKKFAGDYILYTSEKKLKINSELVNISQRAELEDYLRSLNLPFEETAVKKHAFKNS